MTRLAATGPNSAQIEYWNNVVGDRWTARLDRQDKMLAPLGEAAMAAADIGAGQRVIDIGCGCATTTLELAQRVGPTGHVLAIDVSTPMLELAHQRIADAGLRNIAIENQDAAAFAFAPQSFDRAYSRFGVMFFADPVVAFTNIRSGLVSGGRLAFVCWQPLDRNPWMMNTIEVAGRYLERPAPPPPNAPGPFAFRDAARVHEILSAAGFVNIQTVAHDEALAFEADVPATLDTLVQQGPMSEAIEAAPAAVREQIRADLAAVTERYLTDDGVRIDSASWIVSADAP